MSKIAGDDQVTRSEPQSRREGPKKAKSPLRARVEKERSETKRTRNYVVDLKIRTPASLIGQSGLEGVETAPALVRLAKVKGIDVIGITDHYSGKFISEVQEAARNRSVTIIPGVELRCKVGLCDDVMLSCLFPESLSTEHVEEFLRSIDVPEEVAGKSSYIVEHPLAEILVAVEQFRGVAFPSRVDKTPHRLLALPELVEEYGFRTFDLAYNDSTRIFKNRWPDIEFFLFSFSNAQALAQVGSRAVTVKLVEPNFAGLKSIIQRDQPAASK